MELYVEAGFTPMEALQAATTVPARVMGVEKEAGTLEPGKRADLVILGATLTSIENRDEYLKKQAEAQFAVPEAQLVEKVRAVLARHKS